MPSLSPLSSLGSFYHFQNYRNFDRECKQFGSKIRGGGAWAPRAPLLDPPLLKEARINKLEEECNGLQLSFFSKTCQSNCFTKFILLFVKQPFVILSLESLSFTYTANGERRTANASFELKISQNRKRLDKRAKKQFLWIKSCVKLLIWA